MAIKVFDKYSPRANAPDSNYPDGSIKNESVPGANDGTPLDQDWGNDWEGVKQSILSEAGVIANGTPDSVSNPQILDSLKAIVTNNASNYTDIVYKASGGNSSVENMVAGIPFPANVGDVVSTGNTTWMKISNTGALSDFNPINDVSAIDWGIADDSGQTIDQTVKAQGLVDEFSSHGISFGSLRFLVSRLRISGRSIIDWGDCSVMGRVQYWIATFSSCKANDAYIQFFEVIGSQHTKYEGIFRGELLYLQNNVPGFTGMYWLSFDEFHYDALQVRQAAYQSGALSGFNVVKFTNSTFKSGSTNNQWSVGGQDFAANVWIRDQDFENSEGGTYPTYTEDGTDPALSGNAKWEMVLTQPLSFDNFDFSYSTNYSGSAITTGIKNEGQPTVSATNGFIEGVDYSHFNVGIENTECRPAGGKDGNPVDINGELFTSGSKRLGTKFGNLAPSSKPEELNFEFKNALSSRYSLSFGCSKINISDLPFYTESTSNSAIRIDDTTAGYLSYTFTAKKTGVISICARGSNLGLMVASINSGPGIFGLGYKSTDNEEYYSVGTVSVTSGDSVRIQVPTSGGVSGGSGEIAYLTGFSVFYGRYCAPLQQWQEKSVIEEGSSVVITDQNSWNTIATLTGGNYKSDSLKITITARQLGSGNIKAYWEGEIQFGSSSALTVTERVNITSIIGTGSTQVAVRIQEQSTGVAEIQVQKGFFGSQLDNIAIESFDQVTEQLILTLV